MDQSHLFSLSRSGWSSFLVKCGVGKVLRTVILDASIKRAAVSPAFDNVRMTDKRPMSQHVKKEANYAIRGDPKSLNQLSSSGKAAQSRRGKTLAQEASEASSSRTASSEGSNSASKGGNGQKK